MDIKLVLRELHISDEAAFLQFYQDWQGESPHWATFVWKPGMSMSEHLQLLVDQKDPKKIPATWVPSTMLYGFVGNEIVGRLSVRHTLNENLLHRGGHVGFSVSPRHRKKGYASEIFRQGLEFCRARKLFRVLVTCAEDNPASWKVIEKFGGVLENSVFDEEDQEIIRRYWVSIIE